MSKLYICNKEEIKMNGKAVSGIMLIVLLIGMLTLAFYTQQVKAESAPTNLLIDEGHSEWLVSSNAQILIQALEDNGHIVDNFSGTLTQSLLSTYSVLVIGTAWGSFAQSEIQAIDDFVKDGGGLWLTGLGWSWVDYHPGSTIEDYPMNKIAQRFGTFFNPDIIFDPTDYTTGPASAIFHTPFIGGHPVTQGVMSIGAAGAFHGSISIQTGIILTMGDDDSYGGYHESPYPNPGSHPPNCAAIQYGLGKVIVISQEGFFTDGHINEFDNKMLGVNIVDWLAAIVIPAGVDVDPDAFNLKSKGKWITCYIELPDGYDVFGIGVSTIMLNDTVPVDLEAPTEIGDCDEDGILDLMVKFDRQAVIALLSAGEATLAITGEVDGTPFEGRDTIRVIDE